MQGLADHGYSWPEQGRVSSPRVRVTMSSALSYYAAKNRASARLDNKKNEISRSSAYMIDTGGSYGKTSYTPSYDTLKRESSFTADSGRAGRTRYRDTSVDYSTRPRLELNVLALKFNDIL